MVCGLAMVLCMMIGLLLSAVYSHLSYRSIIGKLHYAIRECPQKPALAGSLDNLESPLLMAPATTLAGHRYQRDEFRKVLHEAKDEANRFLHSLADLKPSADVDPMAQSLAQEKSVEIASRTGQARTGFRGLGRHPGPREAH